MGAWVNEPLKMSEANQGGQQQRGFGRNAGGRGGGRGQRRPRQEDKVTWVPVTKLGRLVKDNKITSLDDIFHHSLKIREYQIIDHFYPERQESPNVQLSMNQLDKSGRYMHETVMSIKPVQKQTSAGQRTRFKAYVLLGNCNGYVALGHKSAKEVATAIRGAIINAKLNMVPVRRGYWGASIGQVHTIPVKLSAKCGSVRVRLIPAPRGSGIVGSPTTQKILFYAGVNDCFSSACGQTCTRGNFATAVFEALKSSYSFLTPDQWQKRPLTIGPYEKHSAWLASTTA